MTDSPVLRAVQDYAKERIADLTTVCTMTQSTDVQIRQAQAGIVELQRLIDLPNTLTAEAKARSQQVGGRKDY